MPFMARDVKVDTNTDELGKEIIQLFEQYFSINELTPKVHFELEGCVTFNSNQSRLDYETINSELSALGILGELKDEYWQNQWEYVSKFVNQTPSKEASDLDFVIKQLPGMMKKYGVSHTHIKPVVWAGDKGQLASGSKNIFTKNVRDVHIPNAVQINVSAQDSNGNNLIANTKLGEFLQQRMLQTSYDCCLLFLPEEEAFSRIELKTKYGLDQELCSPTDISGGHQGSIALYRTHGKHNQKMGESALILDSSQRVLVSQYNWQETARVEHRLGASSMLYDAYANTIFALANLADALELFMRSKELGADFEKLELPTSLYCLSESEGAISLFENESWFANKINRVHAEVKQTDKKSWQHLPDNVGQIYKSQILERYLTKILY